MAAVKIFFDGGCRPNPGPMETAVVARGIAHVVADAGHGSSSEAEWRALLAAVALARAQGWQDVVLVGDSLATVEQARGRIGCRNPVLDRLRREYQALAAPIARVRLRHVPRARNLAGTVLEKRHGRL